MTEDLNKDIIDFFPYSSGDRNQLLNILNKTSEILCDWYEASEELSPLPKSSEYKPTLPCEFGCDMNLLLNEINDLVFNSFNPSHPGSLAHLDPPVLKISILGDLISAGLNNNLLADELSPSITKLEKQICEWLAMKIGFENISGGIAASGGTLNNLNALVAARYDSNLEADPNATFIISEDAHVSFKKCTRVLGLNEKNLILIKTDKNGRMNIETLKNEIEIASKRNKKIFAVIATLGTTIRGAIDPIEEIGKICKEKNIWFHIDGSIGGVFAIIENKIEDLRNINLANSITINPQKILGIAKTSSILIVKDIEVLKKTFQTGLPYIDTPENIINRGELGVQGSRPAEIIKLWLGLKSLGIIGIKKILDSSIYKKLLFEKNLDKTKFDIFAGPLHIVSFIPKNMNKEESNEWTLITKKILLDKHFMISRPFYKDRYFLRVVMGNYNTKESHILELTKLLNLRINE